MLWSQGASVQFSFLCYLDKQPPEKKTRQDERPATQSKTSSDSSDLLWRDYFRNPSQWWDTRNNKSNLTFPDFQHTKKSLWIHAGHNPCWVQEELRRRGLQPAENEEDGDLAANKRMAAEEKVLISSNKNCQEDQHQSRDALTLVALLKSCAQQKDLKRGSQIHTEAVERGLLKSNLFIGSAVVNMYAKCGVFEKAQEVFEQLPIRNVVSWNALIGGYAQYGHGEKALNCFKRMQLETSPNAITFACILKACGIIRALDKGQEIHAQIAKELLLDNNIVLANAMVDMYAKCGALGKAQEVFDGLRVRDVVSWTVLIAGYAQHGYVKDALSYYDRMQQEGMSPNAVTLVCMLKACGSIGALAKGQEIHGQAVKDLWLEKNIVVANAVVDMYTKCGALEKAKEVFDKLDVRDLVSWTALITGYVQHGHGEEALDCYARMQLEGFCPNGVTFSCLLKACGSIGAIDIGQKLHAQIGRAGLLGKDIVVANALIDMYVKCGALVKAQQVFEELGVRDVVSWTAMIGGYAQHEHGVEALKCFEQMLCEGFSPDAITFACALKACGSIGAQDKGQDIHTLILSKNILEKDIMVANALVDMYAKCGLVAKAQEVFDGLRVRDVITWNALIAGYVQHEYCDKAMNCFSCMQLEGFFPDAFTFACVLKACGSIGYAYVGQKIHAEVVKYGFLDKDMVVGTGLVDMYANCGMLAEAQDVFDMLPVRNIVSWSAFMEGYAQLGKDEFVIIIFDKMVAEGGVPDSITMTIVLNTCSHRGLLDKGQSYFEIISRVYGIIPNLEHYTCMVDLLCRAGHFDMAASVIKEMPISANVTLLHTLLGACRNWGNMKLGRWAFKCAVELDEKDGASYVGMGNIYGAAGRQKDASKIHTMRVKKQALTKPEHSCWTDTSGIVNSFSIGNNDHHHQIKNILAKLDSLALTLPNNGYSKNLRSVPEKNYVDATEDVSCGHTERLAIACALINTYKGTHILVIKNRRVCGDCHCAISLISQLEKCIISVRDANRFHIFVEGKCVCEGFCNYM